MLKVQFSHSRISKLVEGVGVRDFTFLQVFHEQLRGGFSPRMLDRLHYQEMNQEHRPNSKQLKSIGFSWKHCYYPFPQEDRVVAVTLFDHFNNNAVTLFVSHVYLEAAHPVQRSTLSHASPSFPGNLNLILLNEKTSRYGYFDSGDCLDRALICLHLSTLSQEKIVNLPLRKTTVESILELKKSFEEALANEKPKISDPVKALLLCFPENGTLFESMKQSGQALQSYSWPSIICHDVKLELTASVRSSGYSRDFYQRSMEQNGFLTAQLLCHSGKMMPISDKLTLDWHGLDLTQRIDEKALQSFFKSVLDPEAGFFKQQERLKFETLAECLHRDIPVYLVKGYEIKVNRIYWPVKGYSFLAANREAPICELKVITNDKSKKPDLSLSNDELQTIGIAGLYFQSKDLKSYALFANDFFYAAETGVVVLHPYYYSAKGINTVIYGDSRYSFGEGFNEECEVGKILGGGFVFDMALHEGIAAFIGILRERFGHFIDTTKIPIAPLRYEGFKAQIDQEKMRFYFKYQTDSAEGPPKEFYLANFTSFWSRFLRGADSGFNALISEYEKEELAGRKKLTRPNCLKLLRHSGAFLLLVYETLDWCFNLAGAKLKQKDFEKALLKKLVLLFQKTAETDLAAIAFSSYFTRKLETFIIELISDIVEEVSPSAKNLMVWKGQIFEVPALNFYQGKLIHFTIQQLINLTAGDVFQKGNNKYFRLHLFDERSLKCDAHLLRRTFCAFADEKDLQESKLSLTYGGSEPRLGGGGDSKFEFRWQDWLGIESVFTNAQVKVNGRSFQALSASDFKVEFEVSTEETKGIKNATPINWFDLHPQYFLNGTPITLDQAQAIARNGVVEYEGQLYVIDIKKLPTYRVLELFWQKLASTQGESGREFGSSAKGAKSLTRKHHVLELLALRKMGVPFKGGPEWEEVCRYFDELSEPHQKIKLDPQMEKTLKPYQKNGVQWLWDLYHLKIGGILADDMGLGKTLQSLCFIDLLRRQRKPHRALVIVPVSLVYNWMAESEKFTPNLKVAIFDAAKDIHEDVDLMICTYGLLTNHHEKLTAANFDLVLFDEAQALKNREAERTKAATQLKADFKVALTGTPMENHFGNLYTLMNVVAPGVLGSFDDFSRDYIKPDVIPSERIEFLRAQLKPLILRRTKQQILSELPEKTETEIKIDFTAKQKDLYKKTALAYSEKITQIIAKEGERSSQIHMLAALLRLRQICSDPNGLPNISLKETPPKLEYLFETIEEILSEGHSVIVFTQFMNTFDRVKEMAAKKNLPLYSLCGADSKAARVKTLKEFNETEKAAVLLMTLKTGGVGLNLTKASYVFHLEPWWNPAVENQATDRVHRIGQTKSISVYRLIMRESVEEKVELLKARKGALFAKMFGENYFSRENIDMEEGLEGGQSNSKTQGSISKSDFDILLS